MKKSILLFCAAAALLSSCKMENPLLTESPLPYGAPQFDKIKTEHYLPAIKQGIEEGKAEIDAIVANQDEPTFENTVEALEYSGELLGRVLGIFYNILEADNTPELQQIAEEASPILNEYSMYVSLNQALFDRVRAVYDKKDSLNLEKDQMTLLDNTYKQFVRGGALLDDEQKKEYSKLNEELSLASLAFGKNLLDATNAYKLNITDESQLAGLPQYVIDMAAQTALENEQQGWTFDLSYPSYSAFMQFSEMRDLRRQMYMAYNTRAVDTNADVCKNIAGLRLRISNLLGYGTYADYALEERMVKNVATVENFLDELTVPALPKAKEEVAAIEAYAKENGFGEEHLQNWDFSYWSEKLKKARYDISDEDLKPYFQLEDCIDAVFGLATRLYGIQFNERIDIPVYHKDVKVFDVTEADGTHLALFYCDFFPRASKRGGAWMTEFRGQSIQNGVEKRPFVSIVTNFSKPTHTEPSLLTHDEFTTFLHEFGHSIHGMLAEGRYESICGTNVKRDFVELPSQIMENWGFEPEYLNSFAKHYKTGEVIPEELIKKVVDAQNYNAAYAHIRQLQFGILDMAWHTLTSVPEESTLEFEKKALEQVQVLPVNPETCISTTISHLFSGGYAAGYYSYKWAEVLAADAYSLFSEKGIFNTEVSGSFRSNILSRGSSEDEAVLYRNFRGHDPEPRALLVKLGIVSE